MEIKLTTEVENALFNRKEVEAQIESDITPKVDESCKLIAKKYSVPEENVKVKGVFGSFGSHMFKVIAFVYKTKEDKENTEVKTKQEKEAEKKAAEEAAKEAKEAAKKAEEEKKAAEEAAKAEAEKPKEETSAEENKEEGKTE